MNGFQCKVALAHGAASVVEGQLAVRADVRVPTSLAADE